VETIYFPLIRQDRASTTMGRSEGIFEKYLRPVFGERGLHELNTLTLQTYLTGLDQNLSHESRDKIRDVLSGSLRFAVDHGLLTINPAQHLRVPRERHSQRKPKYFLTPDQFCRLLSLIREPYATMVYVAILTGLRVSELIALKWNDIHHDSITVDERDCRGNVDRPKSGASCATIPVHPCVLERIHALKTMTVSVCGGGPKAKAVRRYKITKRDRPEDLVFQSVRTGSAMRDNNILARFIKPAARQLEMPWVNRLVMRRSHSNWLRMAGADLKDRQAQMRHAHPQVTADVYDQFIPENQRRVVDKLGKFVTNATNPTIAPPAYMIENMVARDGVEPPTPAFSGLRSTT
jgi:integrase